MRCYDKVRELAPYRIEHVDVPWNGTIVSGNLHLAPGDGREAARLLRARLRPDEGSVAASVLQPGAPARHARVLVRRPGAGREQSARHSPHRGQLRGRRERGRSIICCKRPEVDAKKIGVYALSFGSYWGMRIAAKEQRIAAVAAPWASFVDKYYLMTEESPRYKQLFAYLTQSETEEAARQGRRRHAHGRPHGQDHVRRRCS